MNQEQWRSNATLEEPIKPSEGQSTVSSSTVVLKRSKSLWTWAAFAFLVIITVVVVLFLLRQLAITRDLARNKTQQDTKVQEVDLSELSGSSKTIEKQKDTVVINGQLEATNGVVLTPSSEPVGPQSGQLYYDQDTNDFKYYNGNTFVGLLNDNGDVCNKNDETCGFALQSALAALQAQVNDLGFAITEGGVNTLQGKQGNLSLLGTGGLSITASGTSITLALPQNLTTSATPQFSDLSLTGGDFSQDGVLIVGGSGSLYSVDSGGAPGLCLVTDGSGVPEFNSCVAGAVGTLNGLSGTLTINSNNLSITDDGVSIITIDAPQDIDTGAAPTFDGITITDDALFQPSADSSSLFQIQNASGDGLLQIDSVANTITLHGHNNGFLQDWVSTTGIASARKGHGMVAYGGHIYVVSGFVGGTEDDSVESIRILADGSLDSTWNSLNAVSGARTYPAVIAANGFVYMIGGFSGTTPTTTIQYAKLNADGTVGDWNALDEVKLNTAVGASAAVVANGYVYVVGGATTLSGTTPGTPVALVQYAKLNADGSVGDFITSANDLGANSRMGARAVVANGYMYIVGGQNAASTAQQTVYSSRLNLDGSNDAFASAGTLNTARSYHGVSVMNGYLYAFGGGANSSSGTTSTEFAPFNLNGTVGAFTNDTTGLLAANSVNFGYATTDGYIYRLGGETITTAEYSSGPRLLVAGSLDLVSISGETLTGGSTGGSLTAGNTNVLGLLTVADNAAFLQNATIDGDIYVGGQAAFRNTLDSENAFSISTSSGVKLLKVDTESKLIQPGQSRIFETKSITTNLFSETGDDIDQGINMAIGSDGKPILASLNNTDDDIVFIKCRDVDCSTTNTPIALGSDITGGNNVSMTVGTDDGLPIIAFKDNTVPDNGLWVIHCGNLACTSGNKSKLVVAGGGAGGHISIVMGADGRPIIFHRDSGNDLEALWCGEVDCMEDDSPAVSNVATTLSSTDNVGTGSSATLVECPDPDDGYCPAISHLNNTGPTDDIQVTICADPTCQTVHSDVRLTDPYDTGSGSTDIVTLLDGSLFIVRNDSTNRIGVARCTSYDCSTNTQNEVVSANAANNGVSVMLGRFGAPLIFYTNNSTNELVAVQCANFECSSIYSSTNLPTTNPDTGSPVAMLGSDGMPVIISGNNDPAGSTTSIALTHCLEITCSDASKSVPTGGISLGSSALRFNGLYIDSINSGYADAKFKLSTDGDFIANGLQANNDGDVSIRVTSSSALKVIDPVSGFETINVDTVNGIVTIGDADDLTGSIALSNSNHAFSGSITTDNTLTADRTYTLPDDSGEICLSSGNCSGSGSSATLQAAYEAGNTIDTDNATDIEFNLSEDTIDSSFVIDLQCTTCSANGGRFAVQSGGTDIFTLNPNGGNLVIQNASSTDDIFTVDFANNEVELGQSGPGGLDGKLVFNNSTNLNTLTLQSGVTGGAVVLTLPVDDGASGDCLQSDGNGVLSFAACTGGAGGGVTNINSITGVIDLLGTANQITVSDNSPAAGDITLSLPQNIHTGATPQFSGVLASSLTTAAAGTLSIGTSTATAITLGATGITTTNAGAFTSSQLLTAGLSSGTGLSVTSNADINGTILVGNLGSPTSAWAIGTQNIFTGASTDCILGCYGLVSQITADNPTNAGTSYGINALYGRVTAQNSTALSSASGLVIAPNIATSGTITSNYGIRVQAQTAGTSDYGIAVETADTQTLWLASNDASATTAAKGIAFGSSLDTTLFRSAANTLAVGNTGGAATLSIAPTAITSSGALTINTTTNSTLTLDSGTTGAVNLGTSTNPKIITIGNTTGATSLMIQSGTGTINIGTGAQNRSISIGNGAAVQTVTVGSTNTSSALTLQAGTGGLNITTQGTGALAIGNNAVAQTINIGNSTGATAVSVLCGTGTCGFGNNATAHGTTIGSTTGASLLTLQGGTSGISATARTGISQAAAIGNGTSVPIANSAIALEVSHTFSSGTSCGLGCYGLISSPTLSNASSQSYLAAYSARPSYSDSATLASAIGFWSRDTTNTGGGTITDNFGIYVDAQTVGTNDYGIAVGAADTQTLWLSNNANNTVAAAGIAFGSSRDTNLYRSATNTLRTDTALSVGASLTGTTVGTTLSNGSSTGDILRVVDGGSATPVLSIADEGAVIFRNKTDSATGLLVQNAAGVTIFNVDTTNSRVGTASVSGAATNSQIFTIRSGNATGSGASDSGDIIIRTGNSTNSNSGDVELDVGSAGGTLGSISIGSTYVANAINIGQVGANFINSTVNIGTATNGTQNINIGSSNAGTTAVLGATTVTNRTSGAVDTLAINNSTSTGNILVLQDNGSTVFTVADGGTVTVAGDIQPSTADTYDIGSSSAEYNRLYLGDGGGLLLGNGQDATLAYDEATDDRVELTGTGASLFIEDRLGLGAQSFTVADSGNGSPATGTLTPTASYVEVECNDADSCDITMGEGSAKQGDVLIIVVTTAVGTADFSDSAGVSELAGAFNAGVNDSISMIYTGSTWVEISRSDN